MTDSPHDLEARVGILEREVARLREESTLASSDAGAARLLAAGADHDVSEVRSELRAHTRVLNALRETQLEQGRLLAEHGEAIADLSEAITGQGKVLVEHGEAIATLDQKMNAGFATLDQKMNAGFATLDQKMNAGFATLDQKMNAGFATLTTGMAKITALLESAGSKPD